MKKTKPILIFSLIIIFTFILASVRTDNFNLFEKNLLEKKCELIYNEVGERNVILRVDDIQEHAWFESQERIIKDAHKRSIPLVVGIIPSRFKEDKRIWNIIMKRRCEIEIALHGYEHTFEEFGNLSFKESNIKIKKGLKVLNEIDPKVSTFIPPNNVYSKDAELAVNYNGIEVFSAGLDSGEYGITQSTYDWENLRLNDYSVVLSGCKNDWENNKTCIIMIHPQDYVNGNGNVDEKKYKNYIKLLEGLDKLDANVITFRDLARKDYLLLN